MAKFPAISWLQRAGLALALSGIAHAASAAEIISEPIPAPTPPSAGAALADRNGNRISDGLEERLATLGAAERVEVVVTFSGPGNAVSAQRAVGPFNVEREFNLINGFAATMRAGQARALANVPGVFRVEEVFPITAYMQTERQDFGVEAVHAITDHENGTYTYGSAGYHGDGIGICIVDTGIRATHIAFGGRVLDSQNFTNDNNFPHWHGTHVAGIAAGEPVGTGIGSEFYGVAPRANLYDARVLDSNGSGTSTDVIQGIEWCAGLGGVHVINLSLGFQTSSDGSDSVSQTVNQAVAAGKVVVVAAGNAGATTYTIGSPAAAAQAITAGAVTEWSEGNVEHASGCLNCASDGGVGIAGFSSRGPTADERVKPDIAAPGVNVWSAYTQDDANADVYYAAASGTSMATPFVAGTAALMLQANGALTPQNIREILYNTAQSRGASGKDVDYGHGLVDVQAAVETAAGVSSPTQTLFPTATYVGAQPPGTHLLPDLGGAATPVNVTVLIDGQLACAAQRGPFCLGFEWDPDLDARLLLNGAEIDLSTCMADEDTDCGEQPGGRQETLFDREVADHTGQSYELEVFVFSSSTNDPRFSYEISGGALAAVGQDDPVGDGGGETNDPPVASFTFSCTELACDFTDTSTDGDGNIASWSWDFGDGSTSSTAQNPSHTYGEDGTYTVTLTITDDDGATDTASQEVTVSAPAANNPPTASFTSSCTHLTCSFTDASTDGDGSIASWSWSFGDGGTSTQQHPSHGYAAGGTYTVTLTVTDDGGATDSVSQDVTVSEPSGGERELLTSSTNEGRTWTAIVDTSDGSNLAGDWSHDGASCSGGTSTCTLSGIRKNVSSVDFTSSEGETVTVFKP